MLHFRDFTKFLPTAQGHYPYLHVLDLSNNEMHRVTSVAVEGGKTIIIADDTPATPSLQNTYNRALAESKDHFDLAVLVGREVIPAKKFDIIYPFGGQTGFPVVIID